MAVFSKILTMLRGDVRAIGQSIVDNNASRIYEQEIIEAQAHVASAPGLDGRDGQGNAGRARNRTPGRRSAPLEALALEALGKGQEELAAEVA
ncbi:PspA/IM30 family protein [Massilia sp. H-1]|nr:PspA/IM30 family protein [Massilia sp. H-1]